MKIFEMNAPFVTPRDIALTPLDSYGMHQGETYAAFHKARPPMNSTRTTLAALKFDRRLEALSTNETRVLYALMFHPYVIDIREQYPFCDDDTLMAAQRQGRRVRRTDMTTLDVVVTYVTPDCLVPRYHAISVKNPSHVPTEKDARREERERAYLERLGWSWELVRGADVTDEHYTNCRLLYRTVRDTDIWSLYDLAAAFSHELQNGGRKDSANTVRRRAARKLGLLPDAGEHLFATAVAFGFLRLEPTVLFDPDSPIVLAGDCSWTKRRTPFPSTDMVRSWAWI
ncbi:TnsA endonuclease N-terminal domain-containing protein [Ralstonia pseudosolanacearum]|uniref:TnsA endonuclease N-terminal domain-containing protein n=1 Tax=Ralstonia pseudosolanacearum TaxID=1310165 RepID=UPI003AAB609D